MTLHRSEREPFPPRWWFLVLALMIVLGLVSLLYVQVTTTAERNTAQANSQTLAQDIQTICSTQGKLVVADRDVCAKAEQVQQKPTESIPGPKGEPGNPGKDGANGKDGQPGKDSTVPGPPGKDGKDGAASTVPGPAGKDGRNGADSTVPGPQGIQGEPGRDSTVPGPAGRDGVDGKDGATGPAPSSFTFTYLGTQYTCTPNPPGSTTYTCSSGGLIP